MGFKNYLLEAEAKVGKTIISQIKALDKWALPAWNAKDFVYHKEGVQFDVRGSKFRGRVIVALSKRDLYNIEFGNVSKDLKWKSKKKFTRIDAENLVNVLDGFIG